VFGVVHAGDAGVLEGHAATVGTGEVGSRVEDVRDRVAAVQWYQFLPVLVGGGGERGRGGERGPLRREATHAGHHTDRAHGDVAGRHTEVAVQPLDRTPRRVVVRQRLAHTHEHDVAHALWGVQRGAYDLFDDLADVEVTLEPSLAGGAERARHR